MAHILRVTANTVLKTKPVNSSELSDLEKVNLPQGEYLITDYEDKGNHLLITLEKQLKNKSQWYVFEGHIDALGLAPYPENTDKASEDKGVGKIKLPGLSQPIGLSEPVISSGNFTWAEATKNGTRIPMDRGIVSSIIEVASRMEEVRDLFGGQPITVTSWYRDPATNRRVGGASKSTHMQGHGIDFNVAGFSPQQVQRKLENFWKGGLGYGRGFTHLDCRNYRARWNYGS